MNHQYAMRLPVNPTETPTEYRDRPTWDIIQDARRDWHIITSVMERIVSGKGVQPKDALEFLNRLKQGAARGAAIESPEFKMYMRAEVSDVIWELMQSQLVQIRRKQAMGWEVSGKEFTELRETAKLVAYFHDIITAAKHNVPVRDIVQNFQEIHINQNNNFNVANELDSIYDQDTADGRREKEKVLKTLATLEERKKRVVNMAPPPSVDDDQ